MLELDAFEVIASFAANALASFTIYFSFTFAYLPVCYLVGSNLSKFQAIAVSILYLVSSASVAITVVGNQMAIAEMQKMYPSVIIDRLLVWDARWWHVYVIILFVSVTIVSFYFMYDCRRKGNAKVKTPPDKLFESDP